MQKSNHPWKIKFVTCAFKCALPFRYKQLAGGIVFVEELPKNATGKVLRKELRT